MCMNSTEENKNRCESMKNKTKKAVSNAMREKAEEALAESKSCENGLFMLVREIKVYVKLNY